MKTCSRCKENKPLEDFSPNPRYKSGRASRCKQCQAAVVKAARASNPEKEKQQRAKHNKNWRNSDSGKAYLEKNKEKIREYHKKRNIEKSSEIKAKARIYYQEHKKEYAERAAKKYQENKEQIDSYNKKWREEHPEEWAALSRARRARTKNAPVNDLAPSQWLEICATFNHCCAYCGTTGVPLTQDHLIPLSKGGSHTASNIVPACKPCNSKKGTGTPLVPVQPLLLTLAPPKQGHKRSA